jgi:2-(1,2-epoxy-1,2-dihydrophenyl)acetyl-CoA isomerase
MTDSVLVQTDGALATVTLNRPDQRNALDTATKVGLRDALQAVGADESIRAVLLAAAGPAFCVGQDLAEHAAALASPATSLNTVVEHYNPIVTAITTMPKPVVAAVNGVCVGAGFGFALACDLRVISSAARFGTAFNAIGLTCDSGLSATLVRSVGLSRATELVLLGAMFPAEQAVDWGISGAVVAPEEVAATAQQLAGRLAAGPTRAYAESKALLHAAASPAIADVLAAEGAAQARLGMTTDHQGAVSSFLAKQTPTFTGA